MEKRIAILAVQGAFVEHEKMLEGLGCKYFEIRQKKDLEKSFDGLIIPGGESTVQGKLIKDLGLFEPLKECIDCGVPVFGTCAGLILLADKIEYDNARYFGTMPMTVRRNAYGRQLGSFFTESNFNGTTIPMTFIRAPYISDACDCDILSEVNGKIVAARFNKQLAVAFHPELNDDYTIHKYFINMIE